MKPYKNISKKSGITAYECGDRYLKVRFISGDIYEYTDEVTGHNAVSIMKRLAEQGMGLSTFITRFVKHKFIKES